MASESPTNLSFSSILPAFEAEGFPLAGAVDFNLAKNYYAEHANRYQEWIQSQKQGEMAYLERGLARRLDPKLVFPELKSVIVVAKPYSPHAVESNGLRYARYLNGPDYHEEMQAALSRSFKTLSEGCLLPPDFKFKICVDTSAVLERTWAAICGLGWIGKNTLLINPQLGSYLFLGVIFTNAQFNESPKLLKDYCGNCTRCLSACPTGALSNHDLDARKCISYLTLEKRGEWEQKYPLKGFLAGCDLCQEVCPYNTKPVRNVPLGVQASYLELDQATLQNETEEQYRERVSGTALSRIKYQDFKRNLKAVLE